MRNLFNYVDMSGESHKDRRLSNSILKYYWSILSLSICLLLILSQLAVAQTSQVSSLALHTVSSSETLFAIANRYGTTVEEIVANNQLDGKTIYVGQRLYVPSSNEISAQAPNATSNNNSDRPITVASQGFYVTVEPGESLLGIALRHGVAIGELATVNNISDVTNIPAGSSLYIPAAQAALNPASHNIAGPNNAQVNPPAAQHLPTVAEGSGVQNIQIVASRHRIGAGSSVPTYPNGPQVSIGVAPTAAVPQAPAQGTVVKQVGLSSRQVVAVPPPVVPVAVPVQPVPQLTETVVQPVGGFVPQDQSPKQQLLQQQMVLLRKSGPQLAIFQPPLQEFAWPLAISGRISSNYGKRKLAITSNRFHYGLDLAAKTGTSVKASKSGVVKEASWIGGYGNAVYIDHPDGTQTRYAHMSKLNVEEGDSVSQGDVIGKVGSTGVSTGPHLHFEIRVAGYAVDPLEYIAKP